MITVDKVPDEIETLSIDDQEFIEHELQKRISEKRRTEILLNSKTINKEIEQGEFKKGTVDDFLKDINK